MNRYECQVQVQYSSYMHKAISALSGSELKTEWKWIGVSKGELITWIHGEGESKLVGEEVLRRNLAHVDAHPDAPAVLQVPALEHSARDARPTVSKIKSSIRIKWYLRPYILHIYYQNVIK